MNATPRRRLRELLGQHGIELVSDARRTKALLLDLCTDQKLEVSLLCAAQEERVAADLLKMPAGTPKPFFLDQLARRLQQRRGFTPEAARWAVDSWALALGIVSSAELSSTPPAAARTPPPPPNMSAPQPPPRSGAGSQTQAAYAVPHTRTSRAELATALFQGAMTAGPWALNSVRVVTRVFQTLRHTTRALREIDPAGFPRGTAIVLGGALVGALSWAPGGALGGAFYVLVTAAVGTDTATVSAMESILNWLVIGACVAALAGALTGALIGVIRFYGEIGGTLFGGLTGLVLGLLLSPFSISSVFQVGILTGALFAVVSLGMISGQGRNILALTFMAMGMAGTSLRRSGGWAAVGKGALWGGLGGFVAFIPLAAVGFRGAVLTTLVGWVVGMISGALIGEKYKWLKIL
jgi:hypothetical protein